MIVIDRVDGGEIMIAIPTKVKYTEESGLPDWKGNIVDEIVGYFQGTGSLQNHPTDQIPNITLAKEIQIGSEVASIGNYAFMKCEKLESVTIPDNVTNIGKDAFYFNSRLKNVTMENSIENIGEGAFTYCDLTGTLTIPSKVTLLSRDVFSGNRNIVSIIIPEGVTQLSNRAFFECEGLTSVELPDSVTTIGPLAIGQCTGLTEITFGKGISWIDDRGLYANNCRIFDFRKAESVPRLRYISAFQETPSNKEIIVPDSLYDSWKTADNWNSTSNNIVNCIVKASESSLGIL